MLTRGDYDCFDSLKKSNLTKAQLSFDWLPLSKVLADTGLSEVWLIWFLSS